MEQRHSIGLVGLVGFALLTMPARAADPVAMVEDIKGTPEGIQFMDYLTPGKVIQLGAKDTLVVDYFRSCVRETIKGGVVTIGTDRSTVLGGDIQSEKVACDGGQLRLSLEQSGQSGLVVYRAPPKPAASGSEKADVERTLYGLSPVFNLLGGGGRLVVERLDKPGQRFEFEVQATQTARAVYYDFAKHGESLTPGGVYRATAHGRSVVFKIHPTARPGEVALAGRLVQL